MVLQFQREILVQSIQLGTFLLEVGVRLVMLSISEPIVHISALPLKKNGHAGICIDLHVLTHGRVQVFQVRCSDAVIIGQKNGLQQQQIQLQVLLLVVAIEQWV